MAWQKSEYKCCSWKNWETAMAICFTISTGVFSITGFHNLGKSFSLLWYFFMILIQKNFSLSKYSSTSPLTCLQKWRLWSSTWSKIRFAKWGNLLQIFSIVPSTESNPWILIKKWFKKNAICLFVKIGFENSGSKQQISCNLPLAAVHHFCLTKGFLKTPNNSTTYQSEHHLTVFYIDQIAFVSVKTNVI